MDPTNYWLGPYGVRVENRIKSVVSSDGGNTRYKDGGETEMGVDDPPTEEEWLNQYATLGADGIYYYKE